MWDTVQHDQPGSIHLSHDRPCQRCGHGMHVYLACDSGCDCQPLAAPQRLVDA
ncbi:hypothetical protein NOK12_26520 [Nocardioides sp. OK12]|uniref:Uncharacterized protein n=1 Tax=Nocardioides marinisabuli TaxID=419476 RepID=A0A7Y9JTN6_9ACTN|nr:MULTISPECIES: hypothetical protein [Nocardioides]NYD59019.1 hypothetical protein [Nocardioides marinisabuli]GHJ60134.1 hypothetical protein NOK12_26520 [Nocardioides sp. OK12]